MADKYKIDSHKLMYHVPRVYQWLQGENIYPIYIEIGLYGGCNHRCIFCAVDFLNYKPIILEWRFLRKFLVEAVRKGVKSILYSGEGEPFLHKDAEEIIIFTKKLGIDVALATNGVFFDKEKAKKTLGCLTWIKFSLDADNKKTYARIHGTKEDDLDRVITNIKDAVKIRNKNKYNCAIGGQFLLMPYNYKEVIGLAGLLRKIGVDYLVVKPYSPHPSSKKKLDLNFRYENFFYLEEKLNKYSNEDFQVIFRHRSMEKLTKEKPYKYCLGLPFATQITVEGDIYPCNVFLGKKEFIFGNIRQESFKNIWEGQRRKKIAKIIYNKWDVRNCRNACRLDEINNYLWELKNPSGHVNFI